MKGEGDEESDVRGKRGRDKGRMAREKGRKREHVVFVGVHTPAPLLTHPFLFFTSCISPFHRARPRPQWQRNGRCHQSQAEV